MRKLKFDNYTNWYMTKKEVCKELSITPKVFKKLIRNNMFYYITINRKKYFLQVDIERMKTNFIKNKEYGKNI